MPCRSDLERKTAPRSDLRIQDAWQGHGPDREQEFVDARRRFDSTTGNQARSGVVSNILYIDKSDTLSDIAHICEQLLEFAVLNRGLVINHNGRI